MTVIVNAVRKGFYLDSVALMRVSKTLTQEAGVQEAALMMGTPANKEIMSDAGILNVDGQNAEGGDLVIAVRADNQQVADDVLDLANDRLQTPQRSGEASTWMPRTVAQAAQTNTRANIALISVPGQFAVVEARKALSAGLHVMMFSDNVPIEDELSLKLQARTLGKLMMGPDCGTAIISGVPLAFANAVPRGDIAIVGASGTGIQEISCLIARAGAGISHAIGVGGRDLSSHIGGITTLMAIDALEQDATTRQIVLVSKPPALDVMNQVLTRLAASEKPSILCFVGAPEIDVPNNVTQVSTLEEAAQCALGSMQTERAEVAAPAVINSGELVGLFSGGTLCAEAQSIALGANIEVASNAPVPGVSKSTSATTGHRLLDLGADEYTVGKPHPMIDPSERDSMLRNALLAGETGVVLVDVVIGFGANPDPAGELVSALTGVGDRRVAVIASVTGTDGDPQVRANQVAKLEQAGIYVASSNAAATRLALACIGQGHV